MRGSRSALLMALVLCACGDREPDWGGTIVDSAGVSIVQNPLAGNWTLQPQPQVQEELRIGVEEGDPAYQFGTVIAVDVDDAGRMYVLDQQAAQVRVFDGAGKHVRTVGKPGGGPGELSMATMSVLAGANDVVYVADIMRQRIAAFGGDGAEIGSTQVKIENGIPIRFERSPAGRFVMQVRAMALPGMNDSTPMRDRILSRDPASEQTDTLLELESGKTFEFTQGGPRMKLFESEPMWTVLEDGRIAHGRNDQFRVELLRADGTVERVLTRPTERKPVTEADREALRRLIKEQMERQLAGSGAGPQAAAFAQRFIEQIQFADTYPAFAALMAGPGNTLWVQRIRTADDVKQSGATFNPQDIGSPDWDVFDAQGRLLGPISLPDRFQPMQVEGDKIYGVLRDELDIQHIARLRIVGLTSQPVQREGT